MLIITKQHEQQLCDGLQQLKVAFDDQHIEQLKNYLVLLAKWNKTHNLTAITDLQQMIDLHILDSLSVLSVINGENLLDVGSGAGLPGLIVAIFKPEIQVSSIDTRGKKIQFQQLAAATLGLHNFQAIHSRVEEYQAPIFFDQIISRAFSSLENFTQLTKHLLSVDGEWLAMKGQLPEQELLVLAETYGIQPLLIKALSIPNVMTERHLLIFKPKNNENVEFETS